MNNNVSVQYGAVGPQAGGIGYNLYRAYNTMEEIAAKYNALGNYVSEEWPIIRNVLRNNWVGPDEQGYEQSLVNKISACYRNASVLAQNAVSVIRDYALRWVESQRTNVLSTGSTVVENYMGALTSTSAYGRVKDGVIIKPIDPVVKFDQITKYDEEANFGLMSESSSIDIQTSIENYIIQIQAKTAEVFKDTSAALAFFGVQQQSVDSFIETVSTTVGIMATAIKDLHEALNQVAKANYQSMQTTGIEALAKSSASIEQSVEELGSSRWS